jgi:hypothetical protein
MKEGGGEPTLLSKLDVGEDCRECRRVPLGSLVLMTSLRRLENLFQGPLMHSD